MCWQVKDRGLHPAANNGRADIDYYPPLSSPTARSRTLQPQLVKSTRAITRRCARGWSATWLTYTTRKTHRSSRWTQRTCVNTSTTPRRTCTGLPASNPMWMTRSLSRCTPTAERFMDESVKNFLKTIWRGQYGSPRQRRRLMERELKRLQKKNDTRTSDGVDDEVPGRD